MAGLETLPLAVSVLGRVVRPLLMAPWLKPVKSVMEEMLEGRRLTAFLAILTTEG